MNRGSVGSGADFTTSQTPFNEAPIHESGKWLPDGESSIAQAALQ